MKLRKLLAIYGFALGFFLVLNGLRALILRGSGEGTLFQADYGLPPLVWWLARRLRTPRWVAATLAFWASLIAIGGDAIILAGHQFRWGPDAIPQYLSGYTDLPWRILLPIGIAVILIAILNTVALAASESVPFVIWPLFACIVGLLAIDSQVGTSRFRDTTNGFNVLTSATASIGTMYLGSLLRGASLRRLRHGTLSTDIGPVRSSTQLLSIAVESYGLALDQKGRDALIAPLIERTRSEYAITQGAHRFYGATFQGEVRELCGARLLGNASTPRVMFRLSSCLPARLRREGFDTEAIHGNGGDIYSRAKLYPAMGFRRTWFYEDLRTTDPNVSPCFGTLFNGACDARVYERALSLFDGQKRFVHVMTLDSHLPVPFTVPSNCPSQFISTAPLCSYAVLIRRSLAQLGSALSHAKVKPDLVFVYGDHAPPFNSAEARNAFAEDAVPFLVLQRRKGRPTSRFASAP